MDHVILLSIPGLRAQDLAHMPQLKALVAPGDLATLVPSFPAVTWPVQTNMLTGQLPNQHGITANGFYWKSDQVVEMWTAGNEKIRQPQIWDVLPRHHADLTSAVWFPMLSKNCGADVICMPAPVHNPDGSESLWCYTRPTELYGELMASHGHFPLQHFWGPLANLESSNWIANTAAVAAKQFRPRFFYVYLPHLAYAAQKLGPDSDAARKACQDLDDLLGRFVLDMNQAYGPESPLWLVASEYTIVNVDHVLYPNRLLRQAGLLAVRQDEDGETIDFETSLAWALVDHQFSHIYVQDDQVVGQVVDLFQGQTGVAETLTGDERQIYAIDDDRAGEVVVISTPNSWQAYYYWLEDQQAPQFARTVDIHRKPGYDPVELHWDRRLNGVPLDATLIQGSHGAPATHNEQRGILLSSQRGVFVEQATADTDVFDIVLRQFGI